jgi:choice-of-anchor C domain-containing protein
MSTRDDRHDEDEGRPRRPEREDGTRPTGRKKGKPKKKARRRAVPFILIGIGALLVLAIGVAVVVLGRGRGSGDSGTSSVAGGGAGGSAGTGGGASATGSRGPNLLINGGFEDGPEPDAAGPGFTPMEAGSTLIPGWSITRGSVDYIGPYWQHADGRRSIDLNGNEPGAIAQTFRTRPGATYRVTFSLAGNNCGDGPAIKTLVVTAAGKQADFTFDATGRTYLDMGWLTRTWDFKAEADETTLEFSSTTEQPVACGPALDRVSVVEVGR